MVNSEKGQNIHRVPPPLHWKTLGFTLFNGPNLKVQSPPLDFHNVRTKRQKFLQKKMFELHAALLRTHICV